MTSASSLRSSSPAAAKGSSSTTSASNDSRHAERMKSPETSSGALNGANSPSATPAEGGGVSGPNGIHADKLQTLKQRKFDLEKLLNEKNALLEQIQRQEQQIIAGEMNVEHHMGPVKGPGHTNSLTLRKKINTTTSFKLPNSTKGMYATKERSGSVGDMEKKIRQEMMSAVAQTPKTIDMTLSKSLRSMPYAEYDAALFGGVNKLHARRSPDLDIKNLPPPPPPAISIAVDYNNKSAAKLLAHSPQSNPSQRGISVAVGVPVAKYPNRPPPLNQNANYTLSERRNSIKSMQQLKSYPSPKQHRQDDRLSMIVGNSAGLAGCYTATMPAKINRSDYDLTTGYAIASSCSTGYLYDAESMGSLGPFPIMMEAYSSDSVDSRGVVYAGKPLPPQPPPSMHYAAHSHHPGMQPTSVDYDETSYAFQAQPVSRKGSDQHTIMRPMTSMEHHSQAVGLGGYWKTIGSERIWCTVDTCYDGSSGQQQTNAKIKKSNATSRTTPTKSISLGNFDVIVVDPAYKDEQTDKISISSLNSDSNKKSKEKQWLETSLDGPTTSTKVINSASDILPSMHSRLKASSQSLTTPSQAAVVYDRINDNSMQQQLRQTSTKLLRSAGYLHEHSRPASAHYRRATTTATAIVSSKSPTPSSHALDASVPGPKPNPINYSVATRSATPQQQLLAAPPPSLPASNPRSPHLSSHHELIRIESPKNMTVVQPAVFMPYKEVTKPFEMSDFYKYSTKFRQKDKQQTPAQQNQPTKGAPLHVEQ